MSQVLFSGVRYPNHHASPHRRGLLLFVTWARSRLRMSQIMRDSGASSSFTSKWWRHQATTDIWLANKISRGFSGLDYIEQQWFTPALLLSNKTQRTGHHSPLSTIHSSSDYTSDQWFHPRVKICLKDQWQMAALHYVLSSPAANQKRSWLSKNNQ